MARLRSAWLALALLLAAPSANATVPHAAPPPRRPTPVAVRPVPKAPQEQVGRPRNTTKAPVIVEHDPPSQVYAISDVHGRYEPTFEYLQKSLRLIDGDVNIPGGVTWRGGNKTLVVNGDIFNNGRGSIHLLDMFRALEASAKAQGGRVIVLMGNHETSFIADPHSDRAKRDGAGDRMGVTYEIEHLHHAASADAIAEGTDPEGRGEWLRSLPYAARVGHTFFIHGGNTKGKTQSEIREIIGRHLEAGRFSHDEIDGDESGFVATDDWRITVAGRHENLDKLNLDSKKRIDRIVMSHAPGAMDRPGEIARTRDGKLFKIDTGFGRGRSLEEARTDPAPLEALLIDKANQVHRLNRDGNREKAHRY